MKKLYGFEVPKELSIVPLNVLFPKIDRQVIVQSMISHTPFYQEKWILKNLKKAILDIYLVLDNAKTKDNLDKISHYKTLISEYESKIEASLALVEWELRKETLKDKEGN